MDFRSGTLCGVTREPGSPTLTIVVPVYDAEPFLAQCLDSILSFETFEPFNDPER